MTTHVVSRIYSAIKHVYFRSRQIHNKQRNASHGYSLLVYIPYVTSKHSITSCRYPWEFRTFKKTYKYK